MYAYAARAQTDAHTHACTGTHTRAHCGLLQSLVRQRGRRLSRRRPGTRQRHSSGTLGIRRYLRGYGEPTRYSAGTYCTMGTMGPANGPSTFAPHHARKQRERTLGRSLHPFIGVHGDRFPRMPTHGASGTREVLGVLTSAPSVPTELTEDEDKVEERQLLLYLVAPRKHMVWSTRVLGDTLWTRWPPQIHGVLRGYS